MATPPTRRHVDLNLYLCEQTLMWSKFIGGLATLQEAIQSVSSAYIKHTNAVLGEHGAGYDIDTALSKLGENPLLGSLGALQRAASPVVIKAVDQAPEKKERKKRQHDPNAPKRPLTPFFLYMQTARPIIAKDLGDVPKGEVSSEGTKRWTDMAPKDKAVSDVTRNFFFSPILIIIIALARCLQGQPPSLQCAHARVSQRQPHCQGDG